MGIVIFDNRIAPWHPILQYDKFNFFKLNLFSVIMFCIASYVILF